MVFAGLEELARDQLNKEIVFEPTRLNLTRLVRFRCKSPEPAYELMNLNRFVNIARTVIGKKICVLSLEGWSGGKPEEFAWHYSELELMFRRPDTGQLAELLCDLIEGELLMETEVNPILDNGNVSFRIDTEVGGKTRIKFLSIDDLDADRISGDHPNIRHLVERMETALEKKDYPGVLAASSCVFETLAKVVFASPNVESSTFGSIFDGYKKRSKLPEFLLQYAKETYDRRCTEPLSGHGSTLPPSVSKEDAVVITELTKTCVRLERKLGGPVSSYV